MEHLHLNLKKGIFFQRALRELQKKVYTIVIGEESEGRRVWSVCLVFMGFFIRRKRTIILCVEKEGVDRSYRHPGRGAFEQTLKIMGLPFLLILFTVWLLFFLIYDDSHFCTLLFLISFLPTCSARAFFCLSSFSSSNRDLWRFYLRLFLDFDAILWYNEDRNPRIGLVSDCRTKVFHPQGYFFGKSLYQLVLFFWIFEMRVGLWGHQQTQTCCRTFFFPLSGGRGAHRAHVFVAEENLKLSPRERYQTSYDEQRVWDVEVVNTWASLAVFPSLLLVLSNYFEIVLMKARAGF